MEDGTRIDGDGDAVCDDSDMDVNAIELVKMVGISVWM